MNTDKAPTRGESCLPGIIFLVILVLFLITVIFMQRVILAETKSNARWDIRSVGEIVSLFVQHYEREGQWPEPGEINADSDYFLIGYETNEYYRADVYQLPGSIVEIALSLDGNIRAYVKDGSSQALHKQLKQLEKTEPQSSKKTKSTPDSQPPIPTPKP